MSSTPCLHLPVDFERRASVRMLAYAISQKPGGAQLRADLLMAFAVRIWMDWAVARVEWRPLYRKHESNSIEWESEDLTFIIETSAQWPGQKADLIRSAIESKFIRLVPRDNNLGLVLDGFWEVNEHLSPDFKSIQSRGGEKRAFNRFRYEAAELADQRKRIFDEQGTLPFGDEKPNDLEQQLCYALFFRLYRVCGLDVPKAEEFATEAMQDALAVVRKCTPDEIGAVENYVLEKRDEVSVVKVPAFILKNFGLYLAYITP